MLIYFSLDMKSITTWCSFLWHLVTAIQRYDWRNEDGSDEIKIQKLRWALYCYYVAGTVRLLSVPVVGIAPESQAPTESVYNAALALGMANQPTNILRDVGEE